MQIREKTSRAILFALILVSMVAFLFITILKSDDSNKEKEIISLTLYIKLQSYSSNYVNEDETIGINEFYEDEPMPVQIIIGNGAENKSAVEIAEGKWLEKCELIVKKGGYKDNWQWNNLPQVAGIKVGQREEVKTGVVDKESKEKLLTLKPGENISVSIRDIKPFLKHLELGDYILRPSLKLRMLPIRNRDKTEINLSEPFGKTIRLKKIKTKADELDFLCHKGYRAIDLQNYNEAIKIATDILGKDTKSWDAHNILYLVYKESKNDEKVVEHLTKMIELAKDEESKSYLNVLLGAAKQYISDKKLAEQSPAKFEELLEQGVTCLKNKEYSKAGWYFERYLRIKPDCKKAQEGIEKVSQEIEKESDTK